VLYDLDGFKLFNDTFGHPAGDTLLVRLSERLRSVVGPHATAYRMGGDEFCVLFDVSAQDNKSFVHSSVAALCEQSPSFSITASHGGVQIPEEMSDPASVMQLADQRLYRRKEEVAARRASALLKVEAAGTLLATAISPSEIGGPGEALLGDAYDGEDALPLGEHDGGPLAGTMPEQRPGDRRIRRKPSF
jgi:diguanylate cyclase (GGDEF)-like protein